jgi:hypothetical protein
MSGETENDVSGWTTDTLHRHLIARIDNLEKRLEERDQDSKRAIEREFDAHRVLTSVQIESAEKAVSTALASAEKAVQKAETANEKRFESVNEFRAQLTDQASLFLPRTEYASNHENLVERVSDLTNRMNLSAGSREGVRLSAGVLVSVVTVAVVVLGVIIAAANYAAG